MFSFFNRSRRHVAVLAALAMLASVLVAAPAVAEHEDAPAPSYEATFSACVDVPSAGFTDVPAAHSNAGDIDCIAYYGITQGTSDTTYSPLMSVTREHMALFLTRLAGKVDIEMTSTPADAGFADIGDLSEKSQTAINQLADLGITRGRTTTTFVPGDSVSRGEMALFVSKLMDLMDPMAEDDDTVFGYTPSDVEEIDDDETTDDMDEAKPVESPFTDLGSVTKTTYDAITNLYELGVASGISDTSYNAGSSITRAAMAEFMVGVLDHSNARPAGVSIQASKTSGFGDVPATMAVSYRDDSFAAMVDVSITIFHSNDEVSGGVGEFNEDGGCTEAADCAWTDDESLTDDSGNIIFSGSAPNGAMNTYYAWMGDSDEDDNDFDVDDSPHASVTLSSTTDAVNLKVTSDINENSTMGNTVDIDSGKSVTFTVQLVDGDDEPVAKSGVEIDLVAALDGTALNPGPDPLETDDDGQATYTTSGPKSTKGATDPDRIDTFTFSSDVDGSSEEGVAGEALTGEDAGDPAETVVTTIVWTDSDSTLVMAEATTDPEDTNEVISRMAIGSGKGSAPSYVLLNSKNEVTIRATVSFYDQYGNSAGKGNKVTITIDTDNVDTRTVSSQGTASWRDTVDRTAATDNGLGQSVTVAYALVTETMNQDGDTTTSPLTGAPTVMGGDMVVGVKHAPDDTSEAASATDRNVAAVYGDDNRFRIGGYLYSYDSDDVFVDGTDNGAVVDMAKFEKLIGANLDAQPDADEQPNIQVVSYDDDGSSIFRVVTAAGEAPQ